MTGDEPTGSTGQDNLPEGEREAYWKGYNDYFSHRPSKSAYDPPAGYEKPYREGWDTRRLEEDEQLMREWTGLP